MSDINISEERGEVYFGVERYPIKEELITKQKVKIDNSRKILEEIKKKWI